MLKTWPFNLTLLPSGIFVTTPNSFLFHSVTLADASDVLQSKSIESPERPRKIGSLDVTNLKSTALAAKKKGKIQ